MPTMRLAMSMFIRDSRIGQIHILLCPTNFSIFAETGCLVISLQSMISLNGSLCKVVSDRISGPGINHTTTFQPVRLHWHRHLQVLSMAFLPRKHEGLE